LRSRFGTKVFRRNIAQGRPVKAGKPSMPVEANKKNAPSTEIAQSEASAFDALRKAKERASRRSDK
jgi:hypothetical protein